MSDPSVRPARPGTIPRCGPLDHIEMGLPAAFVWDYDDRRPRLGRLYEKSKLSQWNAATDIDWDIEIDPSRVNEDDPSTSTRPRSSSCGPHGPRGPAVSPAGRAGRAGPSPVRR